MTVVATGLSRQGARRTAPPVQVLRTGTDNLPIHVPRLNQPVHVANLGGGTMAAGVSGPDYGRLDTPSVWRKSYDRTMAAARVDALSSGGMEPVRYIGPVAPSTVYFSTRAACSSRIPSIPRRSASDWTSKPRQISMSFRER